jgi:hypothetical protein
MNLSDLDDSQYGQLFDVRRSIRYHDRRRAFFERAHRVTNVLTVLLAGSVLFELAGSNGTAGWLLALGAVSAVLAATDMVVGYATQANLHQSLRARFVGLEIAMLSMGNDESAWRAHYQKRLEIERDEPPIYRALDLLCHNELCRAEGIAQNIKVGCFERLTSQLHTWPNIATNTPA